MADGNTLSTLRTKQEELQNTIDYLEAKLKEARADLIHVGAVLRLFETNGEPQQFPKHINLNRVFADGELFALATAALQAHGGGPLTTREIGTFVVRHKEWDGEDPILHRAVTHRLIYVLSKALKRGRIASPGYEKGVRVWNLPSCGR